MEDETRLSANKRRASLVIGASSAIAQAIIQHLIHPSESAKVKGSNRYHRIIGLTQKEPSDLIQDPNVTYLKTDYSEQSLSEHFQEQHELISQCDQAFICNGLLHLDTAMPEKSMSSINEKYFSALMRANAFVPLFCLSQLKSVLPKTSECKITVFSARIGSISDNRSGGWYAYRSSKAALNMGLKTASIELARSHPKVKLLAFHPGTTNTPLSKPFQARVPKDKLFTPEYVAQQLFALLAKVSPEQSIAFMDWNHQSIDW
ncbi:SDR family NAD(P)-dependent oxidoreductase [Pleionea litopenaei]|uniref:SDR family NAD(P)-dependent oxidoreductase n=1 Tax=Pleionea litopenaei TaxID=3070815 RepID=A0AA51X650_9GAMM|nr:SDR family NAD(P)-dependent oxidoreductase [Pleionea sp. HL-JVS1]WMS86738.1 SDR family NAD(P)-dependent oxidoreductase [Pleionea sp. HL-JVS1]